jgi:hypothetical protein
MTQTKTTPMQTGFQLSRCPKCGWKTQTQEGQWLHRETMHRTVR